MYLTNKTPKKTRFKTRFENQGSFGFQFIQLYSIQFSHEHHKYLDQKIYIYIIYIQYIYKTYFISNYFLHRDRLPKKLYNCILYAMC